MICKTRIPNLKVILVSCRVAKKIGPEEKRGTSRLSPGFLDLSQLKVLWFLTVNQ
jgi:hypothetical protein